MNKFVGNEKRITCRCVYCHEKFPHPLRRILYGRKEGHRRGVFCSRPCQGKQFKLWMTAGMRRDKEYQALLGEREKLRRGTIYLTTYTTQH